ncbi:PREDICTED: cathelicidin-3-like [Charadrius vociferus]|uniref:cathelicidin-3-like n=1 Tax=Charadrius vociferus TaxID=50402 RepID=UPI0005219FED|nr:PREDICTED: cathelicidin-3-like [Charadrius vociferus]
MASSWALVLAVLGGACALPVPAPLAYTQALAQAVDSYNQRPEVQNAFRLLSADPEPAPLIKECSAPVPQGGTHPVLDVTCVDPDVDPVRVKRFWPLLSVAIRTVSTGINLFKAFKRR